MHNNNNEIDLLEILINFILFTKKNIIILLIFCFCGTGYGYYKYKYKAANPYYQTELIALLNISNLTDNILINLVDNLEGIIRQNKKSLLSESLSIPESCSKEIFNIKATSVIDTKLHSQNIYKIKINIKFYNKDCFENIKSGINYYFNNNPFIKSYNDIKKEKYDILISKIDEEILELDLIQKKCLINGSKNNVLQSNSHLEIIKLLEKKLDLKEELSNSLIMLDNQTTYVNPKVNIIFSLILHSLVGLILGYLLSFSFFLYSDIKAKTKLN